MANELAPRGAALALIPQSMDEAMRLAEFMSRAKALPLHLQNSPGDCLMVVEQAMRWNMSPFAVAQATSSIKGKLMFEGKLVAAAIEGSGAIEGRLDYAFDGEGEDRAITVSATRTGDKEPKTVTVALKTAKTGNEWWGKQPDQMLVYHGARVWARRWTPAVILGVYSPEEFTGTTLEGTAVEVPPLPPSAARTAVERREEINREVPIDPPKPELKPKSNGGKRDAWDVWMDSYEGACASISIGDTQAWHTLDGRETITKAVSKMPISVATRFEAIRTHHRDRILGKPLQGGGDA